MFLGYNQRPKHAILGLFEVVDTTRHALAKTLD
jgi:hypothetical protein